MSGDDRNPAARATRAVVTVSAAIAGAVLLVLMVLTTADVAGRYFFNAPIIGVFDLTHFAVLIMVWLSVGYCGFRGGHVVIELLYDRLPRGAAKVLLRVINLVGCLLMVVIAWQAYVQSADVREFNETSQLLQVPQYPLYWVLSFGALLYAWVMALRIFVPGPDEEQRE